MFHPTTRFRHRDPRSTRRGTRRARLDAGWLLGLVPEPLEARVVPTIIFSPQSYGTETAVDGGGEKLPNVTYVPIFWGSYWGTPAGSTDIGRDLGLAKDLSQTTYFTGLRQYLGVSPTVSLYPSTYENPSASAPTTAIGDATLLGEVTNLVSSGIGSGVVPQPRAFGSSTPIYVVITPPGSIDNMPASLGGGQAIGWNRNIGGVLYPQYGNQRAELGNASVIWLSDFTNPDEFTTTLGHESAEVMTAPFQDTSGIAITDPPGQICDNEAEDLGYRLNGTMVQSYWSQADGAFIIPDGNSYDFEVSAGDGFPSQFTEGFSQTLTIVGGQAGILANDSVTLNETPAGAVSATYDGQTVQFDPDAITNVVVNEPGFGSLSVTITGSWASGWEQAPITIVGSLFSSTTINITPASGGLSHVPTGLVSFQDFSGKASIYVNDQAETGSHSWTLDGGTVELDGNPLVSTTIGPAPDFLSLTTGSGKNNVDVEAAPCTTVVNDSANNSGTISLAQKGKSLAAIQHYVDLIGGAAALDLYDQADASNETVTFDGGSITQGNMYPFYDAGVGSVTYDAGAGTDTFEVTPTSKTLANLASDLTLVGGPASSLVVNDSAHAAPTEPSGATGLQDTYAVTGSLISRSDVTWYGMSATSTVRTIYYSGMYGGVTLDADNYGTTIAIEGTAAATPTTVRLGSAGTAVYVADDEETLQVLNGTLSIVGGSGSNSLSVDDQSDLGAFDPIGPGLVTLGPGTISRLDVYQVYITTLGWVPASSTRTINYSGFSSVTFGADNLGTPVDVEGISTATTVNLGSGNTAVTVAKSARSLAALTFPNKTVPLSLVGGTGSDSLTVNDQQDSSYSAGSSVTVSAGSIVRTDRVANVPYPLEATIDYQSFSAGVTLNSDDVGTPVDVESTSEPTAIDVGTGNTRVTVGATAGSLTQLAADLKVVGNTGLDSLVVNDSLDPNASASIRVGTLVYTTSYSYTVTGSDIARTTQSGFVFTSSARNIDYSGMAGGVTLDTDDHGTPVNVESTSTATAIDVGTGNTRVTVGATDGSLTQLAADLTVVGNTGLDSLVVNDSLDPNASASIRVGTLVYTTSYSYTVTGSDIARTTRSGFVFTSTARNVDYSGMAGGVTLDTDDHGTPVDVESTSTATAIDVGTGNTAISVTPGDRSLVNIPDPLTINGGSGTDTLSINDSLTSLAPTSQRVGLRIYSSSYSYTVSGTSITRTRLSTGLVTSRINNTVNYANIKGGLTFDTDAVGTPVNVSGAAGPVPVAVAGGAGINTLVGPALANVWSLAGTNSGTLDGWINFTGFANLDGGGVSDGFDFTPGVSVGGNINAEGGNVLLNYARDNSTVIVNLGTGVATGVVGAVLGAEGVVGGSGSNALVGSGRSLLIGGLGPSQLEGGSNDTLMIAGSTTYDLQDSALEAILDEWDRTDIGFSQRVADLENGTGRNGSDVLTLATVRSNDRANTITSNASGQSWIFARTSDTILGRKSTDRVATLPTS